MFEFKEGVTYCLVSDRGVKFRGKMLKGYNDIPDRLSGRNGDGVACHLSLKSASSGSWTLISEAEFKDAPRKGTDYREVFQLLNRGGK